jgi:hypothetical protein
VSKVLGQLSSKSALALRPILNSVAFDAPNSRNDEKAYLFRALEALEKDSDDDLKLYKELRKSSSFKDIILTNANDVMAYDLSEFTSEASQLCDEFELGGLEDYSLQIGTGKIKVSWLTQKAPSMDKGIVWHEMAHALSSATQKTAMSLHSAQKIKATKNCLNEGFPDLGVATESILLEGKKGKELNYWVNNFTEENWVDAIAGKVLGPKDRNFACYLLDKSAGKYRSEKLLPETTGDTHSTNLFRVLRVHSLKGKTLPQSCLSQMSAAEIKTVRNDCWK